MSKSIEKMLDELVMREKGYVNDPQDSGGETNHGITVAVARAYGYKGEMKDLTVDQAKEIYREQYWVEPRFDKVATLSVLLAEEMLDTGVNMGTKVAAVFLQRALNVLNKGGTLYPDTEVDGRIGRMTLAALREYLEERGKDGEIVLHRLLNDQQGVRYIELSEEYPKNEKYMFGWVLNRVT